MCFYYLIKGVVLERTLLVMFTFGRKPLMGLDDDLYVGDGEFPYGLLEEEDPEDSDMDPS